MQPATAPLAEEPVVPMTEEPIVPMAEESITSPSPAEEVFPPVLRYEELRSSILAHHFSTPVSGTNERPCGPAQGILVVPRRQVRYN